MYSPATRALIALRRIVRAIDLSARELERTAGLSPAQRFVLEQLADGPLPTLNALAERTHTTQPTVSVVVARLVQRGLIARSPDPTDGRRTGLHLTASGRGLLRRTQLPAPVHLAAGLKQMSATEQRRLAMALEQWVEAAGLADVPPLLFGESAASSGRTRRRVR